MTPIPVALQRMITAGAQLPGVALGASIGLATGDPALILSGATAGSLLSSIGGDVADRLLSPREEARIGGVLVAAAEQISYREADGQTVREDGFFEGSRSDGDEFVEGVLLAARDSFEERKVPHLGHLIATVAFAPELDPAAAHEALRTAEALSWREYCLLSILAQPDAFPMPDRRFGTPTSWPEWAIKRSLDELTESKRLVYYRSVTTEEFELPSFDLNLSGVQLSSAAILLRDALNLKSIPRSELALMYEALLAVPEAEN